MLTLTDVEQIRNALTKALRDEPLCQWDLHHLGHFWVRSSGLNGVMNHGQFLTLQSEQGPISGHFYSVWLQPNEDNTQALLAQCDCPAGDKETPCYHVGQAVLDLRCRCKDKPQRWQALPLWLQELDARQFTTITEERAASGRKRTSTHQYPENFRVEQLPPEVTAKMRKARINAKVTAEMEATN